MAANRVTPLRYLTYTGAVNTLEQHYRSIGSCLLVISRDSGTVLCSYGELPFVTPEGLEGRDWRDALAVAGDSTAVVDRALAAGVAAFLPPLVVGAGADGDYLMGGMMVPQQWGGVPAGLLFLRPLSLPWGLSVDEHIGYDDVVAVLGVDRLEFSPTWGMPEMEGLMMELRCGLEQLLREGDWLGLPEGATLTVILRGLEPEAALDVCRALLSHLHQGLAGLEGGAQCARACIGLSQRLREQPALTALVGANTALLQAQAGGDERIRFSSPWDPLGQAARALTATGVFRDAEVDAGARRYLTELLTLQDSIRRLEEYSERALELTLSQGGLALAALLRVGSGDSLDLLCAVAVDDGGTSVLAERRLPKDLKAALRALQTSALDGRERPLGENCVALPLRSRGRLQGCLVLQDSQNTGPGFRPGTSALQQLGEKIAATRHSGGPLAEPGPVMPVAREMEKGIEGYVLDNMEGAIDQAVFLSRVDLPVAVVGERGTGKMYVAQVIHSEAGGAPDDMVRLDCRSFRNRREAWSRISKELHRGSGRTLVFKSPQLLHPEIQARLARQLASRTATEEGESRYLAPNRYVALLPESPQRLAAKGDLDARLASVFAGYPIPVPPLRERPRAVLRWAHKILEQESAQSDRRVLGFTPDAEQALLKHKWPGNISEMRTVIQEALARTDKDWVTPVDLGLFVGISADGQALARTDRSFLEARSETTEVETEYLPSAEEALRLALGQALAAMLETEALRPIGSWLDDEIIEAALERSGGDARGAAEFLQTRTRNIGRWLPKIRERDAERETSLLWQSARELVSQWVMELAPGESPPQQIAESMLMTLIAQQCSGLTMAEKARVMGVSTPTFQKRLKQQLQES
ncbi:hypothetical protein F0M18_03145 [Pseudohalioglobus sediminis]|uniref:Sigma-54 factor interaction domain-containing protein n=1 Tax=Pseudohalioglobus sediminis TaxID=2606449 RepID=A0A5B0X5B8_9GAMM|nr:hypothetical protein F0M18_03145 [Pseudohalioglobus sediminis]